VLHKLHGEVYGCLEHRVEAICGADTEGEPVGAAEHVDVRWEDMWGGGEMMTNYIMTMAVRNGKTWVRYDMVELDEIVVQHCTSRTKPHFIRLRQYMAMLCTLHLG
jgi:hypothetical protein